MTGSESSVVVSLAELKRLENDRVEAQAAAERRHDDERREAQAREREAERLREVQLRAAEVERERREHEREKEEQVRLQSMREVDLERARREAELRAVADNRAAIRERELTKHLRKSTITLRATLGGSAILLVVTIAFLERRADRRLDEVRQAHDRAEQQLMDARRGDRERARSAEEKWKSALAELERTKVDLATALERPRDPPRTGRDTSRSPAPPRSRQPRCAPCPQGDPLCGCLDP